MYPMLPKQIEGETNLTYICALQIEIMNYTSLLSMIESNMKEQLKKIPEFYMYYESAKKNLIERKDLLEQILKEDMCLMCGDLTIRWYEPKYNGYMGRCDTCKSNWRES